MRVRRANSSGYRDFDGLSDRTKAEQRSFARLDEGTPPDRATR